MVGMWQIDEEEIKKKHFSIKDLGVCYSHFMYDQNKLHISNLKQTKDYTESIIHRHRCLFYNKNKFFLAVVKIVYNIHIQLWVKIFKFLT